jgi:V/A-type H+-transporting ATPase subunit K
MELNKQHVRRLSVAGALVPAVVMLIGFGAASVNAQSSPIAAVVAAASGAPAPVVRWDLSLAIALSIGLPCLGAGIAVGRVGAAAIGAATEKPELLTRSLIFVALAEGIAIYGLLVAILLYSKFPA